MRKRKDIKKKPRTLKLSDKTWDSFLKLKNRDDTSWDSYLTRLMDLINRIKEL